MPYTALFDPPAESEEDGSQDDPVYVYTPKVKLAVNVAMATGRPLLLRGEPGSGKSSLARHVAWTLGGRYYEEVITSRTRAQELQWHFDALRRLQDAQVPGHKLEPVRYIQPGILWWALQKETAQFRGAPPDALPEGLKRLEDPALYWNDKTPRAAEAEAADDDNPKTGFAVVLLDEIDKADPDVPNNLLDVLGSQQFKVAETETMVTGAPPLIFITTNGERELPEAFLRRCVVLTLEGHKEDMLKRIARVHFPAGHEAFVFITDPLITDVYARLDSLVKEARRQKRRGPSTAEFLDTLRACNELKVKQGDPHWTAITQATLWKAKVPPKIDEQAGMEGGP